LENESVGPWIRQLLRLADLGIVDARVTENDVNKELESWLRDFLERMPGQPAGRGTVDQALDAIRRSVELDHEAESGGGRIPISFDLESRGTRNWFSLVGAIVFALQTGGVLIIDELDASLHPHLSEEIVRMFHDSKVNREGAQLIFSSHDPTLLGTPSEEPPLRRDEIWITEKDRSGATRLYALTDFKPRKSENLERGYLQGRYGGVPFVDHERAREPVS
jgi:hypothetical protein